MKSILEVYRHPRLIIATLIILTALGLITLRNLKIDFNIENLFPLKDPCIDTFNSFKEEFGPDDKIVVVGIQSPDL